MSRKYKIILTVSIILNVLLLGMTGGMMYKKWQWKRSNIEIVQADFSPEARNLIARHFQEARNEMKDEFGKSRQRRKKLVDLLRAENFDQDEYDRTVEQMRDTQNELLERKMEMLKDLALALPPEDRKKISPQFIRPYGPHHGSDKGKSSKDEAK